jgi:uncharacterized protein DUF4412
MRAALLVAVSVSAAVAAPTDLMLRQKTWGPAGPEAAAESVQYASGKTMILDDPSMRWIANLGGRTLTLVDKRERTYTVLSFDDLQRQATRADEALESLPPQAREMLGLDEPASVKPTGRQETIAGYRAREYALRGGPATGTIWVTDQLSLPPGAADWEQLASSLGGGFRPGGVLAKELRKLTGVPLRTQVTVRVGQQQTESTSEVVEVRHEPPPRDLLGVPSGYRRVSAPGAE